MTLNYNLELNPDAPELNPDAPELNPDAPVAGFPFKEMVIEGGGVKIFSTLGALYALEENDILPQISKFAGSSSGALACLFLVLDFSLFEIEQIFLNFDVSNFMDNSCGFIRDIFRLIFKYGYNKGDALYHFIKKIIKLKTSKRAITFKELYDLTGKVLIINAVCLEDKKTIYFSHETHPDLEVALAIKMSMAIPFVYKPVKYCGKHYIDGGTGGELYPLYIFSGKNSNDNCIQIPPTTFGLKIFDINSLKYTQPLINNIKDFTKEIVDFIFMQNEKCSMRPNYWTNTLIVPNKLFQTLSVDVDEHDFQLEKILSYDFTKIQLDYFKKNGKFYDQEKMLEEISRFL